jgi:hypothetical protein
MGQRIWHRGAELDRPAVTRWLAGYAGSGRHLPAFDKRRSKMAGPSERGFLPIHLASPDDWGAYLPAIARGVSFPDQPHLEATTLRIAA